MGIFDRFKKKKEPRSPYVSDQTPPYEKTRPAPPSMLEGEDPFSEEVIAELEAQGFTINWRYSYRLANRYEVKRVCAGGMGIVFIVEDLVEKGKRYAAKTLKAYFCKPKTEAEWEDRGRSINKFLEECNVWVDLGKHRHIVQAEYLEKIEGVPLVMSEFIDGGGLDDWLAKGPLDMATALDLTIQACIGMEYANKKGVAVHRDIKPGNILVTRDGVAKINDFGIAKAVESAETIRPEAEPHAALDSASLFVSRGMGTPPYMAPEQFHEPLLSLVGYPAIPLGVEADIYAFGLVLYEMLTGKLVVQIESDLEIEIQRGVQHIVSIPDVNPGYDLEDWATIVYCFLKTLKTIPPKPSRNEHLNAVILKCLAKEPSKRYHSFTELKEELMQIYREETGRTYHVVDEPAYELNWRNKGKTYWVLGRERESFECYDKALEQNPADILTWLEKGLTSAELGNLEDFGLCMEIVSYIMPSRETDVEQYRKEILDEASMRLRDIKFLDKLASEFTVSDRIRAFISSKFERKITDPFREPNRVILKLLEDLKDENYVVRGRAAKALSELGDRAAIPALINALKDKYIAGEAAEALGKLGDRAAVPALIDALKNEDTYVRLTAAEALRKLGDKAAIPALIDARKEGDFVMRRIAAEAIDKLGEIGERSDVPALIVALKDEDFATRRIAASTLGKMRDRSAVPALMDSLKDTNYFVREAAAEALGRIGDRSAVPALVKALKVENCVLPQTVAEALDNIGDSSIVQTLIDALRDENDIMRGRAAVTLGELCDLGGNSAVPALIDALKDGNIDVRVVVAEALGKLGDKAAIPALIDALKDKYIAARVAEALGKLRERSAVPALIKALRDENTDVREAAAVALGRIGDRSAVPALIDALEDIRYDVRGTVAEALGNLGDKSAMPALIDALRDDRDKGWLRPKAARALGELADKSVVPTLTEALASFPDPSYVFVALRWAYSQPDKAKLSQTKDNLKGYSAFEWYKTGSKSKAQGELKEAAECFAKAIEIDPDWEVPKKAQDKCLRKIGKSL